MPEHLECEVPRAGTTKRAIYINTLTFTIPALSLEALIQLIIFTVSVILQSYTVLIAYSSRKYKQVSLNTCKRCQSVAGWCSSMSKNTFL